MTRTAPARRPRTRLGALPLALALGLGTLPAPVIAQNAPEAGAEASGPALLVADKVFLDGQDTVIAEGNVEALQDGVRLRAARIVYDRAAGKLSVEGPITISQNGREAVLIADAAELDADLRNGIVTGAQLVLNQQLQVSAYQLNRIDGAYSQAYKATISSCHVCDGRAPLWQIRAKRVLHDQEKKRVYIYNSRFEVFGFPVFWLPWLRVPDPTVDRATGFLIPSINQNTQLDTGVKLPYFITLGDHRDITLTPYLSAETTTLEYRYRQAFRTGNMEVKGAFSKDSLMQDETRAYVFADGSFALPRNYVFSFDIEAVSDDAYLTQYGYSSKDRLDSDVKIARASSDQYSAIRLSHYHSLRVDEDNATIASITGDADFEQRHFPARLGGEIRLGVDAHHHFRYSKLDTDSNDADSIVDGRDVTRLTVDAAWLRNWTLPVGLRVGLETGVAIDSFHTAQDAGLPASQTGVAPRVGVTLRWPFSKTTATGAVHVIEPVAQFGWVGGSPLDVANDESTLVEFDEANLLSLSRFPAVDRRERGPSAALGLTWSRVTPAGWTSSLTFGKVMRHEADPNFTTSSGLSGTTSDLLVAGQFRAPNGLSLTARGVFFEEGQVNKAEARAAYIKPRFAFGGSYIWQGVDLSEGRSSLVSEWSIDSAFKVSRNIVGSANWRYDVANDRSAYAGAGLTYTNECLQVQLSVSHRFTSSTIVEPSTDFAFTVILRGLNMETGGETYNRSCK